MSGRSGKSSVDVVWGAEQDKPTACPNYLCFLSPRTSGTLYLALAQSPPPFRASNTQLPRGYCQPVLVTLIANFVGHYRCAQGAGKNARAAFERV